MTVKSLKMKLMGGRCAICRLDRTDGLPEWAMKGDFFSVTGTQDELSIVCGQDDVPAGTVCDKDWRLLKVEGPLDFAMEGVLHSISAVLANGGISIFAVSTYETDYILIKDKDVEHAARALSNEMVIIETE
jgi:uncharacterized protein